jgi:mitochondrial fission protein ELM1
VNEPRIWVLIDNRAGNESQSLGVVEALGGPYEERRLQYSLLAMLPNAVMGATFLGLKPGCQDQFMEPWPDLVIAAGRRTAPVARKIKRLARGACKIVQIMDPGPAGTAAFDLIAIPRHDVVTRGPNTLMITGAPHRVTSSRLDVASKIWRSRFEHLPKPWNALVVGGSTRRRKFSAAMASELGRMASAMAQETGGSLLITTSRRTGPAAENLYDEINVPGFKYRWGDNGDNPYTGYLAEADSIIVTGDSVSMCSEACATDKPVYIYAPKPLITAKHARFHQSLYQEGYARPFTGLYEEWTHPPLNAANDIAAMIKG